VPSTISFAVYLSISTLKYDPSNVQTMDSRNETKKEKEKKSSCLSGSLCQRVGLTSSPSTRSLNEAFNPSINGLRSEGQPIDDKFRRNASTKPSVLILFETLTFYSCFLPLHLLVTITPYASAHKAYGFLPFMSHLCIGFVTFPISLIIGT
jgi:hypothetical protein